ncbi:MAG: YbaB/EbfC family nucleoid-associated protein [Gammaproteobacteria bacterium]
MFKGGMASMMQKAQKMQSDMKLVQDEIKLLSCIGESASGGIKITINGQHQTTAVEIDKDLLNDKEMLEDLVMIAINDASSQVNIISAEKMKGVTGGLDLPL